MPESIMIVEDEGVVALELEQCLTQLGYSVPAIAATGEEAVARALQLRPDLVLMDIQLKGEMDGIEAARQIMDAQGIPVVYLTAYSDDVTVARATGTAPFGYVLKPWEEKSLQIAIDMALHKASLETEIKGQRDWYFSVLRYMGAPMIVADADGKVKFVNASAEQLLAIEPMPDSPRPLEEILDVRNGPGAYSIGSVLETARSEGGTVSRALVLAGRDGVEIPVELTIAAIRGENGTVLGIVLFLKPKSGIDESSSPDRSVSGNLREYMQTELIRLLILQEQGGETTDRFVEGQLDAYRRLLRQLFGVNVAAGESDWRRSLVRSAVRDTHEQTRSILLGHADIARTGQVPRAKLERYIAVMVGRLGDSHGLMPTETSTAISVAPAQVELDRAIYTVLIVNEVMEQALSNGARGPLGISLEERGSEDLQLTMSYRGRDSALPPQATAVLDALVAEVHGSLSVEGGADTVWRIACGRTKAR